MIRAAWYKPLIRELPDFDLVTARHMGWSDLANGDLVAEAEIAGFDVLLTADRNLHYQRNLTGRSIAIVVLETNRWSVVARYLPLIDGMLRDAKPGAFVELAFRRSNREEP